MCEVLWPDGSRHFFVTVEKIICFLTRIFEMNNVLVTGCNGQLGSELRLLTEKESTRNFIFADIDSLDITDSVAVKRFIEENSIDIVVNCAAFTAVDKAESSEEACIRINAEAPGYLAEAVAGRGGSMIHVSTDYVFDGSGCLPYKEDDETCPATVYGRTKLMGEKNVMEKCASSVIIRTAWLYSSFGNNFVKTMIRLGRERKELGVVFDQIGTPTYARDLAKAIIAILDKGIVPGVYHYSNEGVTSWYDFAKNIHRIADVEGVNLKPLHTYEYPVPAKRPYYSVLDKTKIKQTYSIEIPYWMDSLEECIAVLSLS